MKKQIALLFLLSTLIRITSCEKDAFEYGTDKLIVVEAYLYAGEAVDDIYLTSMRSYTSTDTVFHTIDNAEVVITHNEENYVLVPSDSAGYYNYQGDDLEILEGEEYSISISYQGKTCTSTTAVPLPPTGLTISENKIYITEGADLRTLFMDMPRLELSWNNEQHDYYYVLVENIEPNPESIELGTGGMGRKFGNFRLISRPVQSDKYVLAPMMALKQYGSHVVKLYRVNQEYADLYETIEQDSRNLNEPASNIENGLGIFTAFNSVSVGFEVIKQ